MRISLQWLKEFVRFSGSPAKLADELSMLGLEVAAVEDQAETFDKFVVGEIVQKRKHPNADRLSVCTVNVGTKESIDIVCGAPNVDTGLKVAVALPGATIPHDQHDPEGKPFVLEAATVRGVRSEGMICSSYELGIGMDVDGVLVLDRKAKPGTPLSAHLGYSDVLFEIEVTANRGDWLSHLGVAREIAALKKTKLRLPRIALKERRSSIRDAVSIQIQEKTKCKRYSARLLTDVKIGASPEWLKRRLTSVGMRPINNVVDVTNYVMLEFGQPLHAFDYDKLAQRRIVVRCARSGERFTTLDGKDRELRSDTLMICDGNKPIAIGGIMGGANSEINESTTTILLESAHFDPHSIRRTSKHLKLSTDASQRFERLCDIEMTVRALNRAAQLLSEIADASIARGIIDVYPAKHRNKSIVLRVNRCNQILGTDLQKKVMRSLLERLGFTCTDRAGDSLRVTVPSFRGDVTEEIDFVEEVARLYGYNNIETKFRSSIYLPEVASQNDFTGGLRNYLVGAGFHEIVTNSMQETETAALGNSNHISVLNPVSVDMSALRTNLLTSGIEAVSRNLNKGQKDLRLFEIGKAYSRNVAGKPGLGDFREEERLFLALTGSSVPLTWDATPRSVDIYDLKGEIESLARKIFLDKVRFIYYSTTKTLTDETILVEINETYAGYLGRVNRRILNLFDVKQDVYVSELSLGILAKGHIGIKQYQAVQRFPSVIRDLAFVVDDKLEVEKLVEVIEENSFGMVGRIDLFDVYVGDRIGKGKKSCAFTLEFVSREKTLTDKEVDVVVAKIVSGAEARLGARLRDE
jgi:phenylalanyl-tRNA synthetase beta chain